MKTGPGFQPLADEEYELAMSALVDAEFDPAEFVLEEQRSEVHMAGAPSQVFKLVSVKRLTVGLQRCYNSGRGGTWPFEFQRDLRCRVYGEPTHAPTLRAASSRSISF
jgi:hypothetical protein